MTRYRKMNGLPLQKYSWLIGNKSWGRYSLFLKWSDPERIRVFLSWSGASREVANELKQALDAKSGIEAYHSDENPIGNWIQEVAEAIASASVFIVLLTEDNLTSHNMNLEIQYFCDRKAQNPELTMIPIMVGRTAVIRGGMSAQQHMLFPSSLRYIEAIGLATLSKWCPTSIPRRCAR